MFQRVDFQSLHFSDAVRHTAVAPAQHRVANLPGKASAHLYKMFCRNCLIDPQEAGWSGISVALGPVAPMLWRETLLLFVQCACTHCSRQYRAGPSSRLARGSLNRRPRSPWPPIQHWLLRSQGCLLAPLEPQRPGRSRGTERRQGVALPAGAPPAARRRRPRLRGVLQVLRRRGTWFHFRNPRPPTFG